MKPLIHLSSIFECILFQEDKPRQRVHRQAEQASIEFMSKSTRRHIEVLQEFDEDAKGRALPRVC